MPRLRRIFLSYAREDRLDVQRLVEALRILKCEVWLDDSLSGGQTWWDVILNEIRTCDQMAIAISPAGLRSDACAAELAYGMKLQKPILPVLIRKVSFELIPAALSNIQYVDFMEADQSAAFRLAAAVNDISILPPFEGALPEPPPPPVAYLASLSERARAEVLTLDEQLALVSRLEEAAKNEPERAIVLQIAELLEKREDFSFRAGDRLQAILASIRSATHESAGGSNIGQRGTKTADLSVKLLKRSLNERLFGMASGKDTWFVHFEFRPLRRSHKVSVDGVEVTAEFARGACSFDLQRPGGQFVNCELAFSGIGQLRRVAVIVAGNVLWSEGE